MTTGFRLNDLLTRRVSSFRLDAERATLFLEGGRSKNRQDVTQPLPRDIVPELREFLSQRSSPSERAFRGANKHFRGAEILRDDLTAAEIEYETGDGIADFHALRVTFVTNLARAGVPLAQAVKLARHSTPMLTAMIYSRFGYDENADAIYKIFVAGGSAAARRAE